MKKSTLLGLATAAFLVFGPALLLSCVGCAPVTTRAQAPADPRAASVPLQVTDGGCSATIYLDHTILTAAHCLAGGDVVSIGGRPAKSLWTLKDKTDHVFVVTNLTFEVTPPVFNFTGGLPQGTTIRYYGSPLGIPDQYRLGYVTGTCKADYCFPGLSAALGLSGDYQVTLLSVMGQHGDSGAGIFNDAGEVVGVVSLIQQEMPPPFTPMGALPFTFTAGDIATVALMNDGAADALAPPGSP